MKIKKKIIVLSSCALILSPLSIPIIENQSLTKEAQAEKAKYKLVKTNTYTKTISQQNKEDAAIDIAATIIGSGGALAGYATAGKLATALGIGGSVKTLLTGGNTYPLVIKERVYEKTNRTNVEKQNYYGYAIVDVYNKNTGKKISSKKVTIAKLGV
ncbi:hypothetical protein AXF07_13895 [Staphylococcus aureus]|uniref:hypothetical protein n=1 Tax=Staphylococcus aureus TaxID=1280 RepID=UPI002025C058|nr:hypothetical protein [Staphylococcus aureus]MCL9700138.1 hypothetical protein [Staphylococcus aureus]MCO4445626.1 hypothetical protein [Staphylococcus aureus]UXU03805.1 hypothetical protein MUA10_14260 [Staphylococcus aureus]UXU48682.1 hypothetical protein MUA25_14455 [Staphylococcus aureus]